MQIKIIKHYGAKELWLEFGNIHSDGWLDMLWYNEGRAKEIGYWLKHFFKDLFTKNRYYLIRYGGLSVYLRGGDSTPPATEGKNI